MRLGQLARKLNIKSIDIVEYLQHGLDETIEHQPNVKIPDDLVEKITLFFAPEELNTHALNEKQPTTEGLKESGESIENTAENDEIDLSSKEDKAAEEPDIVIGATSDANKTQPDTENNSNKKEEPSKSQTAESENDIELSIVDGVIKAPKIQLEGVKVVGKIELLEKKVDPDEASNDEALLAPDTTTEAGLTSTEKTSFIAHEKPKPKRKKPVKRSTEQQVLSYQEEIRLEKERYALKRAEEEKRKKALKRKNYEKLMQQKQASGTHIKKNQSKSQKPAKVRKKQSYTDEAPKSMWKRFIHWLNN